MNQTRLACLAALLLSLGAACAPSPTQDLPEPRDGPQGVDTGLDAPIEGTSGCVEDTEVLDTLTMTPSAITPAVDLRWQADPAADAWVLARGPDGIDRVLLPQASNAAGERLLSLVGFPPGAVVALRIASQLPESPAPNCSPSFKAQLGSLPASLPPLAAYAGPRTQAGMRLAPLLTMNGAFVLMFNDQAEAVWAYPVPEQDAERPTIVFRAHLLPDGTGVAYNTQGLDLDDPGLLHRVAWGGQSLGTTQVPGGHTDFVLHADGSAASLGWAVQELEGRRILGDQVLRVGTDGSQTVLWDVFDHFEPDLSRDYTQYYPSPEDQVEDWSHVNSLAFDAATDAYLVTITVPPAVVSIDRETGQQNWVLSPEGGDYDLDRSDLVDLPHSAQLTQGGLLVFNRRDPHDGATCSAAVEMALDEDAGLASLIWDYRGQRCAQVGFLGNAVRQANGNTLVSWSQLGLMEEVDPAGQLQWQASSIVGAGFAFVTQVGELY